MNPIKQCYLAYTNSEEYHDLGGMLGAAGELLPRVEYAALEASCGVMEERAFAAGFRCAVRLLVQGMR